jgi:hypothetical protein
MELKYYIFIAVLLLNLILLKLPREKGKQIFAFILLVIISFPNRFDSNHCHVLGLNEHLAPFCYFDIYRDDTFYQICTASFGVEKKCLARAVPSHFGRFDHRSLRSWDTCVHFILCQHDLSVFGNLVFVIDKF